MELHNPIPAQQPVERKFFDKSGEDFKIVPKYGCSPEEHFQWLAMKKDMFRLSVSVSAVKSAFRKYVFDGGIDFGRASTPGSNYQTEEGDEINVTFPLTEKIQFEELLRSWGLNLINIISVGKCLEDDYIENGDRFLKVQLINTNGVWKVNLIPISYLEGAYHQKGSKDLAYPFLIAKSWDKSEWGKTVSAPKAYSATRYTFNDNIFWDERKVTKVGMTSYIYESVVHCFDKLPYGKYYDEGPLESATDSIMAEIKYGLLTSKISNAETITKLILAYQNYDPQSLKGLSKELTTRLMLGVQKAMKALNYFGSNRNDGKQRPAPSMFGFQYPHGAAAPNGIQVPANRDTSYQKYAEGNVSSNIYSLLDWSKILTGKVESPGGIGADKMINEWLCKSITIDCKRKWYGDFFTWLTNQIHVKITGNPTQNSIIFTDSIQGIVDKMKDSKTSKTISLEEV